MKPGRAAARPTLVSTQDLHNIRLDNGTFTIIGENSGATAQIANNGYTGPGIKPYTGDILYVENREKVTRLNDQVENYKIVLEF